MIYYTTTRGVYAIEPDGSQNHLIGDDWALMSAEAVALHCNPPATRAQLIAAIQSQIDTLERQHIAPRWSREFALLSMQAAATPEQLAKNFGYQAVKTLDDQIAALRAQLEAL
jgi:hypothetical protein